MPMFSLGHVVYNKSMLDTYIGGLLTPHVHPGDMFMLSGRNPANALNWANTLKARFAGVQCHFLCFGLSQIDAAIAAFSPGAISGLMYDYEADAAAPEFTYDFPATVNNIAAAAQRTRAAGFEAWAAPNGLTLPGRPRAGQWDWGVIANLVDGVDAQSQRSCQFGLMTAAVDYVLGQCRAARAASKLYFQVTTGAVGAGAAVSGAAAFKCASYAGRQAGVNGIALWTSSRDQAAIANTKEFLALRDA